MYTEPIKITAPQGAGRELSLIEARDALTNIEEEILLHPILEHPFLVSLSAGEYNVRQVALWVGQQYHFSVQFPRCLAALYARIDDFQASKPLADFLGVEHWGSERAGAHWKQFQKTLEFFGLRIDELRCSAPLPETKEYLDFRLNLCLSGTLEEGLGAIGFGHELVNERIFDAYYQGISKITDITEDAVNYFKIHVQDEPEDYQVFNKLISSHAKDQTSFELVRKGALDVLEARYYFFDRIRERL
jgi:pyrroloquinoline-quinone synthase